ncbi:MAG: hypothetical protein RIC19_01960 [Phaeodactylibacter sp.]|uniref:hypothetical protein n=1 Tax=Phaeodactylibacter sp. TaxID=1940289 RepID=UPI0032ED8251
MKNYLTLAILSASLFTCKTPLPEYTFETIIWIAVWSPNGQQLVVTTAGGGVRVLDREFGEVVSRP